jgi:hypothetical protein
MTRIQMMTRTLLAHLATGIVELNKGRNHHTIPTESSAAAVHPASYSHLTLRPLMSTSHATRHAASSVVFYSARQASNIFLNAAARRRTKSVVMVVMVYEREMESFLRLSKFPTAQRSRS